MMVAFIIFLVVSLGLMFVFPPLAVILFPACVIFLTVVLIVRKRKHRQQQEVPVVIDADDHTVILDRPQGMDDDKTVFMWEREGIQGMIALMDMNGGDTVFQKAIDSEIVIGKDASSCDVCIRYDKTISRRHCKIRRWGNEFFISDEGSSNGTSVNGKVVTGEPVQLATDDVIQLGRTQLKFQILG